MKSLQILDRRVRSGTTRRIVRDALRVFAQVLAPYAIAALCVFAYHEQSLH